METPYAIQLLNGWPDEVDLSSGGLAELAALPPRQAVALARELMSALPVGPAGASEARRLRALVAVLDVLSAKPDDHDLRKMFGRYMRLGALTDSMKHALDRLPTPPLLGGAPADPLEKEYGSYGPLPLDVAPSGPGTDLPQRYFRMDIEGAGEVIEEGKDYTVAVGVSTEAGTLVGMAVFPDEALAGEYETTALIELTVQLDSADFAIVGRSSAPLRVPRTGASRGKARFDISPRHDGDCRLTATVHHEGNFLAQLSVTLPVGRASAEPPAASIVGRPANAMSLLEPRDISLILDPAPGRGYLCTALGSAAGQALLPITTEELARAADTARSALFTVVSQVHDDEPVFQTGCDIPAEARDTALRTLARAGARLFQKLFEHPRAGADARRVGQWLRAYATDPHLRLTVQIVAADAPVPWSMLYLGDAAEGAELDWDLFLGMRHIIEQLPLRDLTGTSGSNTIRSTGGLTLGLNVNPTIDEAMGIDLVAKHRERWRAQAAARGLTLVPRSTRAEVVHALGDATSADQIIYFYCHASASAAGADPDSASIVMGQVTDPLTLGDLSLDAPATVQLAGRPLVFLNACESADLSPRFYSGFVPYFMAKGARGVIGTECRTPVLFAIEWAQGFFDRFLDGARLGDTVLELRRAFLREHNNPLGLLYAIHCDTDVRIKPGLPTP